MGAGAVLEPLAVIFLLFGGTWINRARDEKFTTHRPRWMVAHSEPFDWKDSKHTTARSLSPSLLSPQESKWRRREVKLWKLSKKIPTPNTAVFQHRFLSRVLRKFPFLVEAWYWALIYWVYQLGRAFTAVTIVEGTVHISRKHALQVIAVEKRWHLFWEITIQQFFLGCPRLMTGINWLYSFVHIPGTISFLVWLYSYTITTDRFAQTSSRRVPANAEGSTSGPALYEARRRTMATCNLLAFIIFTLYPCMPPRLLSDAAISGSQGELARSYGFVDTVHGEKGAGSVRTQNRFCNQYAAMPSLHFGYALLIGLTIMTIPLAPEHRRPKVILVPGFNQSHPELAPKVRLPSWRRLACLLAGFLYPFCIFVAIVATANHFILDAVAGTIVCGLGWRFNSLLLNLLPIEDCFLWCLSIHKPVQYSINPEETLNDDE